jgi:hypothetical protein
MGQSETKNGTPDSTLVKGLVHEFLNQLVQKADRTFNQFRGFVAFLGFVEFIKN